MCLSCHPKSPAIIAAGSFNGEVRRQLQLLGPSDGSPSESNPTIILAVQSRRGASPRDSIHHVGAPLSSARLFTPHVPQTVTCFLLNFHTKGIFL